MKTRRYLHLPALLFGTFLFLLSVQSFSQTFSYDPSHEQKMEQAINARYKKDLDGLSGENKKYLTALYQERYQFIEKKIRQKSVLTDQEAQKYLNAVADEIFKNNPNLPSDEIRLLFDRSFYPNASSMGEGTIFFNIGLFHKLQNEAQAAFVVCHEIAHYYLNHSNNNIAQYVNTVYSKEFQKRLKDIQKSDFQQNSQLESLGKNLLFRTRRHGREFEQSADSLALEFLKNTNYDVSEVLSCLALLDSVDQTNYAAKTGLQTRFLFSDYRFKNSWLEEDNGLVLTANKKDLEKEKKEQDSLKTHPDCSIRIERLKPSVEKHQNKTASKFLISKEVFDRLKTQFDYEIINYCYESENISRCIFLTLEALEQQPDNAYLNTMIGKCLNALYSYQKKHELDKIVDRPNPEQEPAYNTVLHFIQNLRLTEIASLSYHFLQQNAQRFSNDKQFMDAFSISKTNMGLSQ